MARRGRLEANTRLRGLRRIAGTFTKVRETHVTIFGTGLKKALTCSNLRLPFWPQTLDIRARLSQVPVEPVSQGARKKRGQVGGGRATIAAEGPWLRQAPSRASRRVISLQRQRTAYGRVQRRAVAGQTRRRRRPRRAKRRREREEGGGADVRREAFWRRDQCRAESSGAGSPGSVISTRGLHTRTRHSSAQRRPSARTAGKADLQATARLEGRDDAKGERTRWRPPS